ncbi:MAG: response regulator transcription factor [Acidobacteriota bacterium]|nr:response regulator transcription factor [Acidobacteriota bacterium]
MADILIIDENLPARRAILTVLERANFSPVEVGNAEAAFRQARDLQWQLILLALPFPGIGGIELFTRLQATVTQTPIIVLTEEDRIQRLLLLEAGADDCLINPVDMRELLARVRVIVRRTVLPSVSTIRFAGVEIDLTRRSVTREGEQIALTPCEYKLLLFFLHNADRPLTRHTLLNIVWGYDAYPRTRTVDAHVMRLRGKFEPEPAIPRHFVTIHGIGYRFVI